MKCTFLFILNLFPFYFFSQNVSEAFIEGNLVIVYENYANPNETFLPHYIEYFIENDKIIDFNSCLESKVNEKLTYTYFQNMFSKEAFNLKYFFDSSIDSDYLKLFPGSKYYNGSYCCHSEKRMFRKIKFKGYAKKISIKNDNQLLENMYFIYTHHLTNVKSEFIDLYFLYYVIDSKEIFDCEELCK